MDQTGDAELLDLIYGAAVEPELWIPVMERLADLVGGNSAFLSRLDIRTALGTGLIARIDPLMPSVYLNHYADQNLLQKMSNPSEYVKTWTPSILTDEDWVPKYELIHTEYYNDFLRPQDIHSLMMIRLAISAPTMSALNLHRGRSAEQFGTAEVETVARLHPHLIRAFKLSEKLSADRQLDRAGDPLFETSSHGLFLVNRRANVLKINPAGEALIRSGLGLAVIGGRLSGDAYSAARRLEALIGAATTADGERRAGGSMAIASPRRRLPLAVTVSPLRPQRTVFMEPEALALVCVTDLARDMEVSEEKLRDLFALTAAEVRVVQQLMEGATPGHAAETLGVGLTTVRSQLANIFAKTGAAGQAELSRLMTRVGQGAVH